MTPGRRMIYPLLERSLVMRHALGAAAEPHLLAEVVPPLAADAALAAGDTDLERDAVADLEPGHPRADGHNDAGRLVAERQRRARAQVPVGELLVVGHVGPAYARRPERDLQLAVSRRLEGPGFLRRLIKVTTSFLLI